MTALIYTVLYLFMGYLGYRLGIRRIRWLQIATTVGMVLFVTWQYRTIVVGNSEGHYLASGLHFIYAVAIPVIVYMGSTWITVFVDSRKRRIERTDGAAR